MHHQVLGVRSVAGRWFCSITWQHQRTIQQRKKHVSYCCTKLDCHKIHLISHAESQLTLQICRVAMKKRKTPKQRNTAATLTLLSSECLGAVFSRCVPLWRRILPGAYSFFFPSGVLSRRRAEIKEVICTRVFKQWAADLVDLLPAEKNFFSFFFFFKTQVLLLCGCVDVCVHVCVGPLLIRRRARDRGDKPHSPRSLPSTLHSWRRLCTEARAYLMSAWWDEKSCSLRNHQYRCPRPPTNPVKAHVEVWMWSVAIFPI